ncbi:MAG TPA: DUF2934 domain-containing protein [Terriglobales bacterium]|jgi:DUF2934 family protein|nr:DUF2934 domain-containing protein [Terriglobales bacterium]
MRRRSTSDPISTGTEQHTPERDEQLRRRAYFLYEQRGRADGHDVDDWLQAEAELKGKSKTAAA